MKKQHGSAAEDDHCSYYGVRLLVRNTLISAEEISAALNMRPDHSWNAGEKDFNDFSMWTHTSWTEGKRNFFDEVQQVLEWLGTKHEFVSRLISAGGELHVIVQLPGTINIGADLLPSTMALAAGLGVRLGIEVFPHLPRPNNLNQARDLT
jgi:hypothetical protein